jgi:hypothetical protein
MLTLQEYYAWGTEHYPEDNEGIDQEDSQEEDQEE